jgi:hypothetical protein
MKFKVKELTYEVNDDLNSVSVIANRDGLSSHGSVIVPEVVSYQDITYTVSKIGEFAFAYSRHLLSVYLPDSVISIGQGAFCGCTALKRVRLSKSLIAIRENCFSDCLAITKISIPESVLYLDDFSFAYCVSLHKVLFKNKSFKPSEHAFWCCPQLTLAGRLMKKVKSIRDVMLHSRKSNINLV